jgi:hypothetical protein
MNLYNKFSTLLRIYFYTDECNGYGDRETFKYVKVSKKDFTKEAFEYLDGDPGTKYVPTQELEERLKSLGYDYYRMGFDFTTKAKYNAEVNKLRTQLQTLETIN